MYFNLFGLAFLNLLSVCLSSSLITGTQVVKLANESNISNNTLEGQWISGISENFDKYLEELGIPVFKRVFVMASKTLMSISKKNTTWIILMETPFLGWTYSNYLSCTDGVEFEYVTSDGRNTKATVIGLSATKVRQEERDPLTGKIQAFSIREVDETGQLIATLMTGNVTARRIYTRVKKIL